MQMVWEAADCVNASVMVLPDVMGNGPATQRKFQELLDSDVTRFKKDIALMAVPQGPTA
jgi:hypothetical protein